MKKLIMILLVLCVMLPAAVLADSLPMVIDSAGLFTSSERAELENMISSFRNTYKMDAVVITNSYASKSDAWLQDYADRYYEDNGYGMGEDRAGFLFMIATGAGYGNDYLHISTAGVLIDYLNDSRRDDLLQNAKTAKRSSYGSAALSAVSDMTTYMKKGREEGTFRYDAETGRRLSGMYNKLTTGELIVALIAGGIVALLFTSSVKRKYALVNKTYSFNAHTQSNSRMLIDKEHFLRESVRRIANNPPNGGHGGSGGGGRGTSVHISSGGMSHGGGGVRG